jgi:hypothetical protein
MRSAPHPATARSRNGARAHIGGSVQEVVKQAVLKKRRIGPKGWSTRTVTLTPLKLLYSHPGAGVVVDSVSLLDMTHVYRGQELKNLEEHQAKTMAKPARGSTPASHSPSAPLRSLLSTARLTRRLKLGGGGDAAPITEYDNALQMAAQAWLPPPQLHSARALNCTCRIRSSGSLVAALCARSCVEAARGTRACREASCRAPLRPRGGGWRAGLEGQQLQLQGRDRARLLLPHRHRSAVGECPGLAARCPALEPARTRERGSERGAGAHRSSVHAPLRESSRDAGPAPPSWSLWIPASFATRALRSGAGTSDESPGGVIIGTRLPVRAQPASGGAALRCSGLLGLASPRPGASLCASASS